MNAKIKMNTITGQVYINNRCLYKDEKGYYTISTTVFMKNKIQFRNDITDEVLVERINNFLNN